MQDAGLVSQSPRDLSDPSFVPVDWFPAVVPGTVLTSLIAAGVYPEPLYGENNRAEKIPEGLCRKDWWYRSGFEVPAGYNSGRIWLRFEGINYAAEVWVNGHRVGHIKGAFIRGLFDITDLVSAGEGVGLAVRVSPQPNPGVPHEHTVRAGTGRNGGISAIDGPTFLCSMGWDWIPPIRDRNTGIWRGVFLSASGPVTIRDPAITTHLPLPRLDTADLAISATLVNHTAQPQRGILEGEITTDAGGPFLHFRQEAAIAASSTQSIAFRPEDTPTLRLTDPALWWPNGYGPQNLHRLTLRFRTTDTAVSDARSLTFGVRHIAYSLPGSKNLTLSVNGVPIFCRGGNWGMDEALKRIPRARLEAQVRMHRLANLNMIRNWVGQSTSEDLYDLCDRNGILLWDEFFQPNPCDGPDPVDIETYLANVRDKVLRFRHHPCIALWCGRNEGPPPRRLNDALRRLMAELDPTRHYQASSTHGGGVHSGGPYHWRPPTAFYNRREPFKTEIGSVSIPTIESIQGMLPAKDWGAINDAWASHDLCRGAQRGHRYPAALRARYGRLANLAGFTRKAQLANYETFRALFEGRMARLFRPHTGVLTWMSHPAQPSFVWQLYHHDLEPNAALYAVRKACEAIHIQFNPLDGSIAIVNHLPAPLAGATARVRLFNLDGSLAMDHSSAVHAPPCSATTLPRIHFPRRLSPVHFIKLDLTGFDGTRVSDNFYWHRVRRPRDNFKPLDTLPPVSLDIFATVQDTARDRILHVTVHNPTHGIALMAHLQLHRAHSGARVLPAFCSDNYLSLIPGETRTLTIEAAQSAFNGEPPLVAVDGWNITLAPSANPSDAPIILNTNAQVGNWPTAAAFDPD